MEGITQVIVNCKTAFSSREEAKRKAREILRKLNLLKPVPASGVMFIRKVKKVTVVEPVVWVRDIETFFYETACGSGTTAIGLVEALRERKSIELEVLQPSGMLITISVKSKNNSFKNAKIKGTVSVISKKQSLVL